LARPLRGKRRLRGRRRLGSSQHGGWRRTGV